MMRRCLPWPCLSAGLLVLLGGCQTLAPSSPAVRPSPAPPVPADVQDLPGGQTPASYRVSPALSAPMAPTIWLAGPVAAQGPPPAAPTLEQSRSSPRRESAWLDRPTPPPLVVVPASRGTHAPDFAWVVGSLRLDERRSTWMVRYAEPGADLCDGALDLLNPGPMEGFAPGQDVRVEGELVDPAPFEIKPAYRVRSLQVDQR